jgi:hypothetical protein
VNVRSTNLRHVEAAGLCSPLGLDPAAGLAEQIHLVSFSDNVIGAEFNSYGPRVTRLVDVVPAHTLSAHQSRSRRTVAAGCS